MTAPHALPPPAEPLAEPAAAATGQRSRSPGELALRRFLRHRLAVLGLLFLVVVAVAAAAAPLIAQHAPNRVSLVEFRQPPSATHWLGTDSAGRDVFSRLLHGGRVSMTVGVVAALTATTVGLLLGATAGFFRGPVDAFIMRVTDVVLAFPSLVVILIVVAFIGPSMTTIIIAIGLFEWPMACRIVRGMTLSIREREFVQAARLLGGRHIHVLRRHILGSVLSPLTVVGTVLVAQAILLEAALSFLGLGVRPPQASWGNMLNEAQSLTILQSMPWLWLPPGLLIALTVLSINFVGDGLRDAQDPRHQLR